MNILILGSEGFIGKHTVDHFLQNGHNVYGADLIDHKTGNYNYTKISRLAPDFEQLFQQGVRYDGCINAAGNGNVQVSITKPFADYESNCTDVFRILDCIRRYNSDCKYIQLSSAAVYGNPDKLPVYETSECKPLSPYGWHKLLAETLCMEHAHLYEMRIAILRPFSVYGPGLRKQLFWDIYQRIKKEKALMLSGTGNESRDFIYITDLVKALEIMLATAPMNGEIYNLASGKETTIREAADYFCSLIDKNIKVHFSGTARAGDPLNWRGDPARLSTLGHTCLVEMKHGLQHTVQWLSKQ